MSIFLNEVKGFLSNSSFESEVFEDVDIVNDRDEIEVLREECNLVNDTSLQKDGEDIQRLSGMVERAINTKTTVAEASPAINEPIVALANHELKEIGDLVGIDAPQYQQDVETNVVSEASMESVGSWLKDLAASIWRGLTAFQKRFAVWIRRISTNTDAYRKRILKVTQLMRRRKSPEGGNYIKISDKFSRYLVLGNGVSEDLGGDLATLVNDVITINRQYMTYLRGTLDELNQVFMSMASYGSGSKVKEGVDYSEIIKAISAHTDTGKLYLGNTKLKVSKGGSLPSVSFINDRPDPIFIIRNQGGIKSLSNEAVASLNDEVMSIITGGLKSMETDAYELENAITDLYRAILRIQSTQRLNTMDASDGKVIAGLKIAGNIATTINAVNYGKLSGRVEEELTSTTDTLYTLNETMYDALSGVVALAEESVLRD